jgi:hypothetical protein
MESQPRPGSESCGNGRVEPENRLEERGGAPTIVVNDDRTSRYLVYVEISEGDRGSIARASDADTLSVLLDSPHPYRFSGRQNENARVGVQLATPDCSRHDGARTFYCERAIYRHSENVVGRPLITARKAPTQCIAQLGQACASPARARYDGRDRQLGLLEERNHLGSHQTEPFVVDKIALGQGDHDPRNS